MVWLLPRPCWGSGGARLPPRPPPPPPPLPSSLADQSLIILAISCQCPSPRHWSRAKKAPGAICTHGWWVLPRVDLWHLTTHNLNNLLSQLKPQQMKFQFNRFFNKFFCAGYLVLKMLSWQPLSPSLLAFLPPSTLPPRLTHSLDIFWAGASWLDGLAPLKNNTFHSQPLELSRGKKRFPRVNSKLSWN